MWKTPTTITSTGFADGSAANATIGPRQKTSVVRGRSILKALHNKTMICKKAPTLNISKNLAPLDEAPIGGEAEVVASRRSETLVTASGLLEPKMLAGFIEQERAAIAPADVALAAFHLSRYVPSEAEKAA